MKRKPHILFLISRFLDGGIDTILVEYLRNIDPSRADVTLAIGIRMEGLEVHLSRIPSWVKVEYLVDAPALVKWRRRKVQRRIPLAAKLWDEVAINPVRRYVRRRRLAALLEDADAVVDFDATFYSDLTGVRLPIVGFYHFSIAENLSRARRHTMRQMEGMASYTHIALICDAMIEEGRRLFPRLADKFVRIYNGYDLAALRERGNAAVSLPPSPYFLSVARLEESQKDITTLLKAYSIVRFRMGEAAPRLVLIGKGRDEHYLRSLAADLQVAPFVDFMGFRPDAAPFMANALALVHSSKYEGLPLAPIEALLLGKPVIASDCPTGPGEILADGEAGVLVQPGKPRVLAEAMIDVATSPSLQADLSERALRRAATFDIHRSVDLLLSLLRIK